MINSGVEKILSDETSKISQRLKQTGDLLVGGARKQVSGYKEKFKSLEGVYDAFLQKILRPYPSSDLDTNFIDSFFGKYKLNLVGIDGTLHKQEVFDLVVFYAGAYSAFAQIDISNSGKFDLTYDENYLERGIGISSVVPIFINEIPFADQTILSRDENGEIDISHTFNDSKIIDNSAYADYMMGLAEFYLAYKLVSKENPIDIVLLDRICSAEMSSFYYETSDARINLDKECGLIGEIVDGRKFTKTEWIHARRLFGEISLGTPPGRGEYLLPRIIVELMNEGSNGLTREELHQRLGLTSESRKIRMDEELGTGIKGKRDAEGVIVRDRQRFILKPEYRNLFERLEKLLTQTCERVFSEDPNISYDERFKIGERWLTTNDLAFLSLISLLFLMRHSWSKNILLIGVAKDTSARDLKRQLLPVLNHCRIFSGGFGDKAQDTPDTDRMLLQWVSLKEREKLKVPWSTWEYDTAFKTIVPHLQRKPGLVSGARRNQISLEKTFVKAYFQLCQAISDPRLRSNVLLYDRLAYPNFDLKESHLITLNHDYQNDPNAPEPVEVIFYQTEENPIQTFIMCLFRRMTSKSIPELFGHLKPLYVADKVAKYYCNQFQGLVSSATNWLINRHELREFLFYLSSFRERRTSIEQSRRIS
jgi:hypothetical protein